MLLYFPALKYSICIYPEFAYSWKLWSTVGTKKPSSAKKISSSQVHLDVTGCERQKPIIPIPQAWSCPRSFPSRTLQGWARKGIFRYTAIHLQSSNRLMYSHTYSVPCYPRHHQAFSSMVNDCFKSSKHCVSLWFQVSPFQLLSSNKNFEGKEASQSLPGLPQTFKSHVNESWCNPKMILIYLDTGKNSGKMSWKQQNDAKGNFVEMTVASKSIQTQFP